MLVGLRRSHAMTVGGIALVMLGFAIGRSSVDSPVPEKRPPLASTSVEERRWLPLEWNGQRRTVAFEHMYFSRERRR